MAAIAAQVAAYFHDVEVSPELGTAGTIYVVKFYIRRRCGVRHPEDVITVAREAFRIMAEREERARAAFRRPPRRRRPPRPPLGVQLAFAFGEAA